ncbi:hypothetical protein FRC02_003307 [Tulasnella sp. 418]|nr:hypothetical protein FRC02_003307 [Tulasnella sp. 418]
MSTAKDHQITCEVPTEPLLQALKSAASASEMSIKLAKRSNTAVLCFQMEAETRQGKRLEITHDLRIKLLRVQESNELKEPMCPPPDIHIVLPSLAKVRTVLERMARLSSHVRISASSEGNLSFEIVSDGVAAEAVWSGLSIPELPAQSSEETEASDPFSQKPYYSVTVPIRSVLKFFAGTAISATTFATICADYCLILHVHIEDDNDGGTLSIYIPAFLEGDN